MNHSSEQLEEQGCASADARAAAVLHLLDMVHMEDLSHTERSAHQGELLLAAAQLHHAAGASAQFT